MMNLEGSTIYPRSGKIPSPGSIIRVTIKRSFRSNLKILLKLHDRILDDLPRNSRKTAANLGLVLTRDDFAL